MPANFSPRLLVLLALCAMAGLFAGRIMWAPPDPAPAGVPAPVSVPEFSLQDLASGEPRSIRDWSGRALIINFWATWCAPCREEMPLLEQVHQQWHERGMAVVGIAIDRLEPVQTFIAETGISYPILLGEQDAMAAAESFGPQFVGLPLTVVAAPGGEILKLHVGELHPADLDRIVSVLESLLDGEISAAEARRQLEPA